MYMDPQGYEHGSTFYGHERILVWIQIYKTMDMDSQCIDKYPHFIVMDQKCMDTDPHCMNDDLHCMNMAPN